MTNQIHSNDNITNSMQKGIDLTSLEKPPKISSVINKAIAWFMNSYPYFSNNIFSHSKSDLAYYLFHDKECPKGSFKQLNEIYDYECGKKGDFINRIINLSPALKAARNRKKIAQQLLKIAISNEHSNPIVIFSLGGGDSRIELEVMAELKKADVYLVSIDLQTDAKVEGKRLSGKLGLANQAYFVTDFIEFKNLSQIDKYIKEASEQFGIVIKNIDIIMAHGFLEYLDLKTESDEELSVFMKSILSLGRDGTKLILSQTCVHDRVPYYEKGLNLYMRLRNKDELIKELLNHQLKIEYAETEPMGIITMVYCLK